MFKSIATRYFYGQGNQDRVISTGSIRVVGIIIGNSSPSDETLQFTDNDGTELYRFSIPTDTSLVVDVELLADNGFKCLSTGASTIHYTVLYNYEGA